MKRLYTFILAILFIGNAFAQTPESFKYQALTRDANGAFLYNQNVRLQVSILSGSSQGTAVYVETHHTTTNNYGLVNLEIGNGTVVSGDFTAIDWGANIYFAKVEMDATGGFSFQDMGTSQLLSVPYALHAKTAESATSGGGASGSSEYGFLTLSADQTTNLGVSNEVEFDQVTGNIGFNSGTHSVTLKQDNTYSLEARLLFIGSSSEAALGYVWYDLTNGQELGKRSFSQAVTRSTNNAGVQESAKAVVTPTTDIDVELRIYLSSNATTVFSDRSYAYIETVDGGVVHWSKNVNDISYADGNVIINNYTQLGSDAPKIKMKKLTGTTAATEGGEVTVAHGLDATKIISSTIKVQANNGNWVPASSGLADFEVNIYWNGTDVYVQNKSANSANVLSQPFTVVIWHEE